MSVARQHCFFHPQRKKTRLSAMTISLGPPPLPAEGGRSRKTNFVIFNKILPRPSNALDAPPSAGDDPEGRYEGDAR